MGLNGYIKLHRQFLDWEWYGDPVVKSVFLDLLLRATHCERDWRGISLAPGQLPTSTRSIAEHTGLSEQQVKTALKKLEKTGEISKKSTNKFSLITVEKWRDYQLDEVEANQQLTNKQPTTNQQLTINQPQRENIKNIFKEKEIYKEKERVKPKQIRDEFEQLWEKYPRKQGKATAYRHYEKARRDGVTFEDVQKGIEAYAAYAKGTEAQYVKMGSTFFSQRAWDDDWTVPKEKPKPKSNVYTPPEPPKYREFQPDPVVDAEPASVEQIAEMKRKLGGVVQ